MNSYEVKLEIRRPCATIQSNEPEVVPKSVKRCEIMQIKTSLYKGVARNPELYRTEYNGLKLEHMK